MDERGLVANSENATSAGNKKRLVMWGALAALAAVIIAVAVAVPVVVTRNNKSSSSPSSSGPDGDSGSGGGSGGNDHPTPTGATSGGDGSEVTMEDGTTFTYVNKFGGYWVSDPKSPFDNSARPNEWTPPLNTTWNYNTDRIYG
jgi:cytoskeletal protein RodZ